jgi:hypothetical protein
MPKRGLRTKRIRRNVRKNTLRRNTLRRKKNIRRKIMKRKNPSRNNLRRKKTVRRNKYKGGTTLFSGKDGGIITPEKLDKIVSSGMKSTKPPRASSDPTHAFDYDADEKRKEALAAAAAAAAADTGFTVEEEIVSEPSRTDKFKSVVSAPKRWTSRWIDGKLTNDDPRVGPTTLAQFAAGIAKAIT